MPVLGVCLYPFVDRHGWDDHGHWHASGLYDLVAPGAEMAGDGPGPLARRLNAGYAAALARWQARLPGGAEGQARR